MFSLNHVFHNNIYIKSPWKLQNLIREKNLGIPGFLVRNPEWTKLMFCDANSTCSIGTNATPNQWGGGPPRAALLGGGKIWDIPKKLEREKYFEGLQKFLGGLQVTGEPCNWTKDREGQKNRKGRQKIFGVPDKNPEGRQI